MSLASRKRNGFGPGGDKACESNQYAGIEARHSFAKEVAESKGLRILINGREYKVLPAWKRH